jgi:glycerophosphoryl diester phosphodiesterase
MELKWTNGINSNDTSRLDGLVQLIKQCGMYEDVIFLSSMKNCLTYLKENHPDANIQFLAGSSTTNTENINWCISNRFTIDLPNNLATAAFVSLMHDAHLDTGAYTVDSQSVANTLIGYGVDMITTNNLGV